MDVDERCSGQHSHVGGAEQCLGVVGCQGGAEEDEEEGEGGSSEEGCEEEAD